MDINIDNLTEDDGFSLYHALKSKFGWTGTVTSLGDVIVYNEGDEAWWNDEGVEALTGPMKSIVTGSYEWRKTIPDRCAEISNELLPKVEIHPNGDFTVRTDYEATRYNADGDEITDAKP